MSDEHERLRRSEALLAQAEWLARLGSWEWELPTGHAFWSAQMYRIMGLAEPEDGVPPDGRQFIHPDDRKRASELIEQAILRQERVELQYRIIRPDGGVRTLHTVVAPLCDETGTMRLIGTAQDVSEQLQAEENLRRVTAHARCILFSAQIKARDSWFHWKTRVLDEAAAQQVLPLEVAPGESYAQALVRSRNPDDRTRLRKTAYAALRAGSSSYAQEYRCTNKHGMVQWLLEDIALEPCGPGHWRATGVCADITRQKQIEEALRHSEEQLKEYANRLEQSNRDLQEFASIASHDLQEPLRKIRTFGDLVQKEDLAEERRRDYIRRMQRAAERMQALTAELLVFSRVSSKGRVFRPVDLGKVAAEVLGDLEVAIQESGARVEVGALPVVQADPVQMRQLLQNLLGNALKFHRPGEAPHVRIYELSPKDQGPEAKDQSATDMVQVAVEDKGIGFDEANSTRVFLPFQRLHGRDAYPGTGMGLAICRRIAERHGGSITAHATPGAGATFIVTLPTPLADE